MIFISIALILAVTATSSPAAPPSAAAPEAGPSAPATPVAPPAEPPAPRATSDPATYGFRFIPAAPKDPQAEPLIYAVYLNDRTLHSGGTIRIKVVTTPDVVKVVSRGGGRGGPIAEIAPGDFEASGALPVIPLIAQGATVNLQFVATGADGKSVTVTVPVRLR